MSRADDSLVGAILLVTPSMQMIEVLASSSNLDVGLGVKLDMEGGRTGRHVRLYPSRITERPAS